MYDAREVEQIRNFALIGSKMTLKEALHASKMLKRGEYGKVDISLHGADVSRDLVNVDLFMQAIPILIKSKLSEKATRAVQSAP